MSPVRRSAADPFTTAEYVYANLNPPTYVDPTGEFAFLLPLVPVVAAGVGEYGVAAIIVAVGAAVLIGPSDQPEAANERAEDKPNAEVESAAAAAGGAAAAAGAESPPTDPPPPPPPPTMDETPAEVDQVETCDDAGNCKTQTVVIPNPGAFVPGQQAPATAGAGRREFGSTTRNAVSDTGPMQAGKTDAPGGRGTGRKTSTKAKEQGRDERGRFRQKKSGDTRPGSTRTAGKDTRHQNAAIAEAQAHKNAIDEGHEIIQAPGKVSAPGPDMITYNRKTGEIVVWDAKYRKPGGSYPSRIPPNKMERWRKQIRQKIENMDDGPLKQKMLDSFDNGKIKDRIFKWPPEGSR